MGECTQPLPSWKLVEAGVPGWAAEFIANVPVPELLDLADAADLLRVRMCVCALSLCSVFFLKKV